MCAWDEGGVSGKETCIKHEILTIAVFIVRLQHADLHPAFSGPLLAYLFLVFLWNSARLGVFC